MNATLPVGSPNFTTCVRLQGPCLYPHDVCAPLGKLCPNYREPSMTMEEPREAPAPDAMNPHESAGALGTDCISEIFFYARKLMNEPPSFVLDEGSFMAEVEEIPLFIREDGYLRRQA